jgi:hypothetical protein
MDDLNMKKIKHTSTLVILRIMDMDKFIITTTPTIEGHPIKAYLGAINVNVVIGTSINYYCHPQI